MSGIEVRFVTDRPRVRTELARHLRGQMTAACQHLVDQTKKTLTGQRTGRRYIIPGLTPIAARQARGRKLTRGQRAARKYTASAPGEPPAVRLGKLRDSLAYRVIADAAHPMQLMGEVGSPLQYAPYLELGTQRMAPRPYLGRTYERERRRIQRILGEPAQP